MTFPWLFALFFKTEIPENFKIPEIPWLFHDRGHPVNIKWKKKQIYITKVPFINPRLDLSITAIRKKINAIQLDLHKSHIRHKSPGPYISSEPAKTRQGRHNFIGRYPIIFVVSRIAQQEMMKVAQHKIWIGKQLDFYVSYFQRGLVWGFFHDIVKTQYNVSIVFSATWTGETDTVTFLYPTITNCSCEATACNLPTVELMWVYPDCAKISIRWRKKSQYCLWNRDHNLGAGLDQTLGCCPRSTQPEGPRGGSPWSWNLDGLSRHFSDSLHGRIFWLFVVFPKRRSRHVSGVSHHALEWYNWDAARQSLPSSLVLLWEPESELESES